MIDILKYRSKSQEFERFEKNHQYKKIKNKAKPTIFLNLSYYYYTIFYN